MKVTWTLKKKRGNWRPILQYRAVAEDWETELLEDTYYSSVQVYIPVDSDEYCCAEVKERGNGYKKERTRGLLFPKLKRGMLVQEDEFIVVFGTTIGEMEKKFSEYMALWEAMILKAMREYTYGAFRGI